MVKEKVIVAMSGGVDSSVAALILHRQGFDVVGLTMRLWSHPNEEATQNNKRCCSVEDVDDARRVCNKIGIPHYFMNFEEQFQEHVVDYFVKEYDRGRTPHPCLACNDKMKFDFLLQRAMFLDAKYIATGHYARIRRSETSVKLLKGLDGHKDQSYVLFTLGQLELSKLMLPVGEFQKSEIRQMAREAGLPVADKPDSQEICFIPDGDYRKFISERVPPKPGLMVDVNNNVLGDHPGIQYFTIGQRRKLGLKGHNPEPMFVTKISSDDNRVILGSEADLYTKEFWASRVNFINGILPDRSLKVMAKIRYKAQPSPAIIEEVDGFFHIEFDEPQRAITPGQAVVFYIDDEIVGGGIIETESPVVSVV